MIYVDELNDILEFIDAMSTRGAIQGNELLHVGILRKKIIDNIAMIRESENERNAEKSNTGGKVQTTKN